MNVRCGSWLLEIDQEATRRAYELITTGDPETCPCHSCKNFIAARKFVYTDGVKAFYDSLGVRCDREAETSDTGSVNPGGLRLNHGWHHAFGRVIEVGEAPFEVSPGFEVLFLNARSCARPPFQVRDPVVQVEFAVWLPWVLSEPPEL